MMNAVELSDFGRPKWHATINRAETISYSSGRKTLINHLSVHSAIGKKAKGGKLIGTSTIMDRTFETTSEEQI
jgi:hypothetical protein